MMKLKGSFKIREKRSGLQELIDSAVSLPEGTYKYIIFDENKNPALPQLKYLFGVVLKTISDELPSHPPVNTLYRYFEEKFAPLHTCKIEGEYFEYVDLKNEKSIEVNNVIERIIHHAATQWGITIQDRSSLSLPSAQEAYEDAYIEMWRNTLNTNNVIHTNER